MDVAMADLNHGDGDILELFMSMFSGLRKDDYGKQAEVFKPLSIERLMEGRPLKSRASIFSLPVELIGEIVKHIPPQSLSNFALVNSDCRQLARSRQFSDVRFDYSDNTLGMLRTLISESVSRLRDGKTKSPSLGACIRRVTITTNSAWITARSGLDLGNLNEMNLEEGQVALKKASEQYFNSYIPMVAAVLENTLPHLESIQWLDTPPVQKDIIQRLAKSGIRHLKLERVKFREPFALETKGKLWPLQSLSLCVGPRIGDYFSTAPFCNSILRLSSSSLEHLSWSNLSVKADGQTFGSNRVDSPSFLSLRELRIQSVKFVDDSMLQAMLPETNCKIHTLFLGSCFNDVTVNFIANRGKIESLKSLGLQCGDTALKRILEFIAANSQLSQLYFPLSLPVSFINAHLVPLLSKSFTRLTSLSLIWEGTEIDSEAINVISNIDSLEQLHLSAGCQFGWKHEWLINHDEMVQDLDRLPNLRRLAFSRDTYAVGIDFMEVERYYIDYVLDEDVTHFNAFLQIDDDEPVIDDAGDGEHNGEDNHGSNDEGGHSGNEQEGTNSSDEEDSGHEAQNVDTDEQESESNSSDDDTEGDETPGHGQSFRVRKWEKEHQGRMLSHGDLYFAQFPKLEWLYIGQIPMVANSVPDCKTLRKAGLAGKGGRDDCYTFITKTFGWPYDV
jgi:hypothetical protein